MFRTKHELTEGEKKCLEAYNREKSAKRYDQNNELRNSMWRFSEREDAVVLKQGDQL